MSRCLQKLLQFYCRSSQRSSLTSSDSHDLRSVRSNNRLTVKVTFDGCSREKNWQPLCLRLQVRFYATEIEELQTSGHWEYADDIGFI